MTRNSALALAVAVVLGVAAGDGVHDRIENASIAWVNGDAASRELTVTFSAGPGPGCAEPDGVAVHETSTTVTLTATTITRDIPAQGKPCPAVAVLTSHTVTLAAPLATRTVIDGTRMVEIPTVLRLTSTSTRTARLSSA